MLISQKIKKRVLSEDKSITISLIAQDTTLGEEQEIDRYIDSETNLAINPVTDAEKFIYKQKFDKSYQFEFYDANAQETTPSFFQTQGFNIGDITGGSASIRNSFYIAQYYNSSDLDNQTLLHQSYLNGFRFYQVGEETIYSSNVINNSEFAEIFLPQNFIDQQEDEFSIFVRYYFYNSKDGKLVPMLAGDNENDLTSSRLFYEVTIDKLQRNFTINTQSPILIKEIIDVSYSNKISNTVNNVPREKQNPPIGDGFDNNGKYIKLS